MLPNNGSWISGINIMVGKDDSNSQCKFYTPYLDQLFSDNMYFTFMGQEHLSNQLGNLKGLVPMVSSLCFVSLLACFLL